MRDLANSERIREFMRCFGREAGTEANVYFTGGTTAVLMGWRDATVDVDLRFDPELYELFRAIQDLQINVELAAPSDFIPPLPGWRDRCKYIGREGKVSFLHYDPYSQALSKIERGHETDIRDVESMFRDGLIEREKLIALFREIEPQLYKYPAIDPAHFAKRVERVIVDL